MFNRISHDRSRGRAGAARTKPRRRRGTRRLSLEGLEARTLLSTLFVDDAWADADLGDTVGGDKTFGTNAFATIQSAINHASSGAEIDVAAGTYSEAITIDKPLSIVGADAATTILDVSAATSTYGVSITEQYVSLSGLTISGSTTNTTLKYGVNAAGPFTAGLSLSNMAVHGMSKSGVNLNGATDFTITNVASTDNGGAGFFLQDAKSGTLTDVTTSGNAWTGLGLSTSGRYFPIGVTGITIAGDSTFAEAATVNGGVSTEESSWDATAGAYDPSNPYPITFSTNAADGADVTFSMNQALGYALSGPQDDDWSVRYRFYDTAEHGLAAAAADPTHFLDHDRTLQTVGALGDAKTFLVAPTTNMSVQAAIDAAAAGDTVQVGAGTYAENLSVSKPITLDGGGAAILQPSSGTAVTISGTGAEASPTLVKGFDITGGDVGVAVLGAANVVAIQSNVIANNGTGVHVDNGAQHVAINWNRIVGNTTMALTSDAEDVDVALNWWGANDDPGEMNLISGNFTPSPWIVLTLSNPGPVVVGGSVVATADLNHDSNGNDVSGLGSIPGVPDVKFVATNGEFSPDLTSLNDGAATSTFTAGTVPGPVTLSATVDGAEAHVPISVTAPTLTIAGPETIDQGETYTLALTAGADAGTVLNWTIDWGDGSDPDVIEGSPDIATHSFVTPGSYTISARAETSLGVYDAGNTVAVAVANVDPTVAITDGPTSVSQGAEATFTATGSDPGGVTGYAWTATDADGQVVANGSDATFAFTPTAPGVYVITVTASDADGGSGSATQNLAVAAAPSVAITAGPTDADQGNEAIFSAASNLGGDVEYNWTATLGDTVFTGSGASFSFTPTIPGVYAIAVVATDADAASASATQTLTVANVDPTVAIADGPTSVNQGTEATFVATGSDPGGVAGYAWAAVLDGNVIATGNDASFAFTPTAPGVYTIGVTALDAQGAHATASQTLTVANVAPTLDLAAIPGRVDLGAPLSMSASATDPNPDATLDYSWIVRRNDMVVATGEGPTITFTPQTIGVYQVVVQVVDGEGGTATRADSFEAVPLPSGPLPPVLDRIAQGVVALATAQTQRLDQRLSVLTGRQESNPSPMVQRLIQRTIRMQAQVQILAARRIARLERLAALLAFRRGR